MAVASYCSARWLATGLACGKNHYVAGFGIEASIRRSLPDDPGPVPLHAPKEGELTGTYPRDMDLPATFGQPLRRALVKFHGILDP